MFISYAQNFEDVMLWRALKDVDIGFYVDVGAQDPIQASITKAFYDRGWRGINIEPVSYWYEKLKGERPRDINLNIAAGKVREEKTFYEIPNTGLSTFFNEEIIKGNLSEYAGNVLERTVVIKPLTEICTDYHVSPIHFLKIDVEGAEKSVLEGLDFSIIRPWILVIESTKPLTQIQNYERWEPIVLAANYDYVYFDGLNRYYLAHEHQDIKQSFAVPPNTFDDFILNAHNEAIKEIELLSSELTSIQDQNQNLLSHQEDTIKQNKLLFNELTSIQEQKQNLLSQQEDTVKQNELLFSELTRVRDENKNLLIQLESKAQQLNHYKIANTKYEEQYIALKSELDENKNKVIELTDASNLWWQHADSKCKELYAVYNSKSWRLMYLLRQLNKFIRWLPHGVRLLTLGLASRSRRIIKKFLIPFRDLPTTSRIDESLSDNSNCMTVMFEQEPSLKILTARANIIYNEFKTLNARKQGSNRCEF